MTCLFLFQPSPPGKVSAKLTDEVKSMAVVMKNGFFHRSSRLLMIGHYCLIKAHTLIHRKRSPFPKGEGLIGVRFADRI